MGNGELQLEWDNKVTKVKDLTQSTVFAVRTHEW